jgi:plasmid replication initiation protein
MKNDLVVMDNNLIRASYKLTANEMRLIFVALSQMSKDPDEPIDPNKAYYISKDDFVRLGVEPKNVAREIREACSDLLNRVVVIDTPIGDLQAHWVLNILHFKTEVFERLKREYPNAQNDEEFINTLRMHNVLDSLPMIAKSDDNIIARIVFHPNMIPYISQLRRQFTKLNLTDMTGFGSFYSYRIYMMLMQFRNTGFCKIHLDDLRNALDLNDKYDATKDLKVWVIDTAVDEINDKSPYTVKYNLIKTGRKFTHLELKFKQKKSKQAQIATETPKRDQTTEEPIKPLTESQIAKYSVILCKLGSLSDLSTFPDYATFAIWLGKVLRDPKSSNQETVKRIFKALRTETDYSK